MKMVASLTPEAQERFDKDRSTANEHVVNLARALQRAAFHGMEQSRQYMGQFDPAPMYLRQATAIEISPNVALQVAFALNALIEAK